VPKINEEKSCFLPQFFVGKSFLSDAKELYYTIRKKILALI